METKEDIMDSKLYRRALRATAKRLEQRGNSIVEEEWSSPSGASVIVARDEEAFVFVNVTVSCGGFDDASTLSRTQYERLAMAWLEADETDNDVTVRFDECAFRVASDGNRALMRYHYNCCG